MNKKALSFLVHPSSFILHPSLLNPSEGGTMTRKSDFVNNLQVNVNLLARVIDDARALTTQWFAEGYNLGGAEELTEADLAEFGGLTVADVMGGIILSEQVENLNDNQPVAQADYASTIAKLRTALH